MNEEDIKQKAKEMTVSYYDSYCGTGFFMHSKGFLDDLAACSADSYVMGAVMKGIIDGIAQVEKEYRDARLLSETKPGHRLGNSPIEKINLLITELPKTPEIGVIIDCKVI